MTHHDDEGLQRDLQALKALGRRGFLSMVGAFAAAPLLACGSESAGNEDTTSEAGAGAGSGGSSGASSGGSSAAAGASNESCAQIPEETEGPYPGDGSNGPNVLALSGIVRSDIRSSFAGLNGTAEGVPLTIKLNVVNSVGSCEALAGFAVYLWHCDRDGQYSLYTVTEQNYLRGLQETNEDGQVTFTTIFPACYDGRWPHVHFEVYPSLDSATSSETKMATSQLALPKETCDVVYQEAGYEQSITNLSRVSLSSDGIFSDGASLQMPTVTGNVTDGFTVELTVAVGEAVTPAQSGGGMPPSGNGPMPAMP